MRKITAYRKAYLKFQVSESRRKLKAQAVEYKGGKCSACGYNKCLSVLAFHHQDPNEKDFAISGNYKSFKHIKPELDKTVLLCANCHGELHDKLHKEHIENRRLELAKMAPIKIIKSKNSKTVKNKLARERNIKAIGLEKSNDKCSKTYWCFRFSSKKSLHQSWNTNSRKRILDTKR